MDTATLTADELRSAILERASEAGAIRKELNGLKRRLAKKSYEEIHRALARKCGVSEISLSFEAERLLYSLTDLQVIELEDTLLSLEGWD